MMVAEVSDVTMVALVCLLVFMAAFLVFSR